MRGSWMGCVGIVWAFLIVTAPAQEIAWRSAAVPSQPQSASSPAATKLAITLGQPVPATPKPREKPEPAEAPVRPFTLVSHAPLTDLRTAPVVRAQSPEAGFGDVPPPPPPPPPDWFRPQQTPAGQK